MHWHGSAPTEAFTMTFVTMGAGPDISGRAADRGRLPRPVRDGLRGRAHRRDFAKVQSCVAFRRTIMSG